MFYFRFNRKFKKHTYFSNLQIDNTFTVWGSIFKKEHRDWATRNWWNWSFISSQPSHPLLTYMHTQFNITEFI